MACKHPVGYHRATEEGTKEDKCAGNLNGVDTARMDIDEGNRPIATAPRVPSEEEEEEEEEEGEEETEAKAKADTEVEVEVEAVNAVPIASTPVTSTNYYHPNACGH